MVQRFPESFPPLTRILSGARLRLPVSKVPRDALEGQERQGQERVRVEPVGTGQPSGVLEQLGRFQAWKWA